MNELWLSGALVLVSLFVLIKSADYIVQGASGLARWFRISPLVIGLTIVAFGTSLPELVVSLFSALGGKSDISLGTIIGSNIANITLGIGICAMITKLTIKTKTLVYEIPFLIISTALLLLLGNNQFIFGENSFGLGRIDGIIFLVLFAVFLYTIYLNMKKDRDKHDKSFKEGLDLENGKNPWKISGFLLGGMVGLFFSGKLFVNSATDFASSAGLSDAFIGLTIASLGTSLPEIITSVVAAWKKQGDLAIGNLVGSDIFNILFAIGATALIKPIEVSSSLLGQDGIFLMVGSLLFLVFATSNKRVTRKEGIILASFYLVYLSFLIWRL